MLFIVSDLVLMAYNIATAQFQSYARFTHMMFY